MNDDGTLTRFFSVRLWYLPVAQEFLVLDASVSSTEPEGFSERATCEDADPFYLIQVKRSLRCDPRCTTFGASMCGPHGNADKNPGHGGMDMTGGGTWSTGPVDLKSVVPAVSRLKNVELRASGGGATDCVEVLDISDLLEEPYGIITF